MAISIQRKINVRLFNFLVLVLMATFAQAAEIDKLQWMRGNWTHVRDGETVQESWLGPRGKMMVAVNLT